MEQEKYGRESLFDYGTWAPTARMEQLRTGSETLQTEDVMVLWDLFLGGSEDAGVEPTLVDFGNWLAGNEPFEKPADVVW